MSPHPRKKVKNVEVKQFHYKPGEALSGSKRFRLPDFKRIGT
jgi:hypothetical protein